MTIPGLDQLSQNEAAIDRNTNPRPVHWLWQVAIVLAVGLTLAGLTIAGMAWAGQRASEQLCLPYPRF